MHSDDDHVSTTETTDVRVPNVDTHSEPVARPENDITAE
jgi:hypothetical protein